MVTVRADRLRKAAEGVQRRKSKTASAIRKEDLGLDHFDVFLSHSTIDRQLVLGERQLLVDNGLTVYVESVEDGAIERSAVDVGHAELLRRCMAQCDALFYAHTPDARLSRWCPWELGYFDALKSPDGSIFVVAIIEDDEVFEGQENLGLYQTIDPSTYSTGLRRLKVRDPVEKRLRNDLFGMRGT